MTNYSWLLCEQMVWTAAQAFHDSYFFILHFWWAHRPPSSVFMFTDTESPRKKYISTKTPHKITPSINDVTGSLCIYPIARAQILNNDSNLKDTSRTPPRSGLFCQWSFRPVFSLTLLWYSRNQVAAVLDEVAAWKPSFRALKFWRWRFHKLARPEGALWWVPPSSRLYKRKSSKREWLLCRATGRFLRRMRTPQSNLAIR